MNCPPEAGKFAPIVDINGCEGKADCKAVCPYDVFALRPITDEESQALNLKGKIKTWVHGKQKAFVVHPENCHACGLCVKACPEKAIKLVKL